MARLTAFSLIVLLLLQTFSRELVVVDYQVNKARITQQFCVNKARPQLHCNGKCHLAKQLRKATDTQSKAPAGGFAKVKYEVVVPFSFRLMAPLYGRPQPPRFARAASSHYALALVHGIFHPPALGV